MLVNGRCPQMHSLFCHWIDFYCICLEKQNIIKLSFTLPPKHNLILLLPSLPPPPPLDNWIAQHKFKSTSPTYQCSVQFQNIFFFFFCCRLLSHPQNNHNHRPSSQPPVTAASKRMNDNEDEDMVLFCLCCRKHSFRINASLANESKCYHSSSSSVCGWTSLFACYSCGRLPFPRSSSSPSQSKLFFDSAQTDSLSLSLSVS